MSAIEHHLYAVVEIMGRRTRAGMISDAQMGGTTLLRIEHPTRADHTGAEAVAEYYSAQSIFAIRPCSADEAAAVARWAWPEPRPAQPALAPAFADLIDDVDDVDDDEGEQP
ncbi:MAG: hypothetical protein M3Y91_06720 [Actinomycetota bacterium]|nr:hypothetical protein [Actinomycetota bacterium]